VVQAGIVSNAGISHHGVQSTLSSLEGFDALVAIISGQLSSAFQTASPAMNDGGRKHILIGSNTAIRTAFPAEAFTRMTKAALTGLVRGTAIDLAPRAITVNNVQPGPTATEMSAGPMPTRQGPHSPEANGRKHRRSPTSSPTLRRQKQDSSTGASLTIDGGYVA